MTNRTFRSNWAVLALFSLVAAPSTQAFTIESDSGVGNIFDLSWELASGASDPLGNINNTGFGLSGTATFEILSRSNTEISFELTLANTTAAPAGDNVGLHAFGFGSDRFVQVASWNNAGGRGSNKIASFGAAGDSGLGSVSIGGQPLQVVATTDGGGAQTGQGIAPGESDVVEFQLVIPDTGNPNPQRIPLGPVIAQFGPSGSPGGPNNPGGNPPSNIGPEPLITGPDPLTNDPDLPIIVAGPSIEFAQVPAPGTLILMVLGLVFGRRWLNR